MLLKGYRCVAEGFTEGSLVCHSRITGMLLKDYRYVVDNERLPMCQ